MMRLRGKIALALAGILMLAALSGCSVRKPSTGRAPINPRGDELYDQEYTAEAVRTPLTIMSKTAHESGVTVNYPFICDDNMALLNRAILEAFYDFAADSESPGAIVEYTTEFNRLGLLSFTLYCVTGEGRTVSFDTASFDSDTGRRVYLSDCFGSGSADHVQKLDEIVCRSIEANGYTLIAQGPHIDDSTLFLFTFGGIYIMFREYELLTYDAGAPRIKITLGALSGSIAQDGLLNRLR